MSQKDNRVFSFFLMGIIGAVVGVLYNYILIFTFGIGAASNLLLLDGLALIIALIFYASMKVLFRVRGSSKDFPEEVEHV